MINIEIAIWDLSMKMEKNKKELTFASNVSFNISCILKKYKLKIYKQEKTATGDFLTKSDIYF